jgi:hypothetical protein
MNATVILAMQRLIITQMKYTSIVVQFVMPILRPQAILILVIVMVTMIIN